MSRSGQCSPAPFLVAVLLLLVALAAAPPRPWTPSPGGDAAVRLPLTAPASIEPIFQMSNLTAPPVMTDGVSYAIWVTATWVGGVPSALRNVNVTFGLFQLGANEPACDYPWALPGSPAGVTWYGYSGGRVNATAGFVGEAVLPWNVTMRAVLSFVPGANLTGSWFLYAEGTSENYTATPGYCGGRANEESAQVIFQPAPLVLFGVLPLVPWGILLFATVVGVATAVVVERRGRSRSSRRRGGGSG